MQALSTKKTERNMGIDLLRIVSMFMVVLLHVLGKGGVLETATPLSFGYNVAWLIESAAFCAVNCYALVSGYVGLNSKHKFSSLVMLWLQVVFYSVLVTVALSFFYPDVVSWKTVIKAFLPITFSQYWYFTAYFGMWFFIPIMNCAIKNIPKKEMGICLALACAVIIPVSIYTDSFGLHNGYGVIWLSMLYLIGAYLSKHELIKKVSKKQSLVVYVICVVAALIVKLAAVKISDIVGVSVIDSVCGVAEHMSINYVSPLILGAAVALLALFSKLNVTEKMAKAVTLMSSLSFSVYLIHTHPLLFDNVFSGMFYFLAEYPVPVMTVGVIISAVIVYILCSAVDYVRLWLFKLLKVKKIIMFLEAKAENLLSQKLKTKNI